jgi:selenocysteine lyase/cysteine desulfurase
MGLASRFLTSLGLPVGRSAIVSVSRERAAARLAAAGVRTSVRAGRARLSFHLYNQHHDVDAVVAAPARHA